MCKIGCVISKGGIFCKVIYIVLNVILEWPIDI